MQKKLYLCAEFCNECIVLKDFLKIWQKLQIGKWGKYVITVFVFLIVYLFIGDQSMLQFIRRGREIRELEEQRDMYRAGTEKAEREMQTLSVTDSLERYAREHYYMHEKNEDIFLVEEEK